jgi:hypothetical protein
VNTSGGGSSPNGDAKASAGSKCSASTPLSNESTRSPDSGARPRNSSASFAVAKNDIRARCAMRRSAASSVRPSRRYSQPSGQRWRGA